jgi:hypothetical protein
MDIQEQWEQDIKDYGDKAYLMWEIMLCGRFVSMDYNPNSFFNIIVRRKQSAELPFDLERAKAGDMLECLHLTKGYLECSYVDKTNITGVHEVLVNTIRQFFWETDLRMKYPPKVLL